MICNNCNAKINDNSKFCTECGNEVLSSNQFSLFSPAGCVSRKTYWAIISVSIGVPVLLAFIMVFTVVTLSDVLKFDYSTTGKDLLIVMLAVPSILLWWVTIVTSLKRLRDANFSAWLYLLNLIPYLGTLIIFILNGFFPSVEEGNKYCKSKNNLSSKAIKWIYTIFLAPILLILVLIGVARLTNDSSVTDTINSVEKKLVTKTDNTNIAKEKIVTKTYTKTPTHFNLTVNTTPSDARVYITNIKPKYYDGMRLKKGIYNIKVVKNGYITKKGTLTLNEESSINVVLEKKLTQKTKYTSRKNVVVLGALMWQDEPYTEAEEEARKYNNWSGRSYGKVQNWKGVKNYCRSLTLAGYSDWRLPSKNELKSIVDKSRKPTIKKEFKNVSSGNFWSSTTYENDKDDAWAIYFGYDNVSYYYKGTSYYVRCVRDGQ